jgi:hypothetical protein
MVLLAEGVRRCLVLPEMDSQYLVALPVLNMAPDTLYTDSAVADILLVDILPADTLPVAVDTLLVGADTLPVAVDMLLVEADMLLVGADTLPAVHIPVGLDAVVDSQQAVGPVIGQ